MLCLFLCRHAFLNLTLFPGQAVEAPTTHAAAVVVVVERAFEALVHVIDILDPGLDQNLPGLKRPDTAAANQYHGRGTTSTQNRS